MRTGASKLSDYGIPSGLPGEGERGVLRRVTLVSLLPVAPPALCSLGTERPDARGGRMETGRLCSGYRATTIGLRAREQRETGGESESASHFFRERCLVGASTRRTGRKAAGAHDGDSGYNG